MASAPMASLEQFDRQIKALKDNLVDAEARVAALREGVIQHSLLRNACTPLVRLPNEILVQIALYASHDEHGLLCALYQLTSICHALRILYINTPELWARVDGGWPRLVVESFLQRTGTRPIHLTINDVRIWRGVLDHLSNVGSLYLMLSDEDKEKDEDEDEDEDRTEGDDNDGQEGSTISPLCLLETLPLRGTQALRSLRVWNQGDDLDWHVRSGFLCATSSLNLRILALESLRVESLPLLPALCDLDFFACYMSLAELYGCLSQVPALEKLRLVLATGVKEQDEQLTRLSPVCLPMLHHFKVHDFLRTTSAIVGIVPIPKETFSVTIFNNRTISARAWSSSAEHSGIIMSRAREFCRSIGQPLPDPDITRSPSFPGRSIVESRLLFGASKPVLTWGSSLEADFPVEDVDLQDPALARIGTITLKYDGVCPLSLVSAPPHVDLRSLPDAAHIVIAASTYVEPEVSLSMIEELETWIRSRHADSRPFDSISFKNCQNWKLMRELRERLQKDAMAASIT